MDIEKLLSTAIQHGASDVHIAADKKPLMRLKGTLKPLEDTEYKSADIHDALKQLMNPSQLETFEENKEHLFACTLKDIGRFRVNAYNSRAGVCAAFRIIPLAIPSFDALDIPEAARNLADCENGIVLAAGSAGGGKSSTLAAMVNHINAKRQSHILTVENPVEFIHASQKSLVSHRDVGEDTPSYEAALNMALLEDVNVLLIGEIRNYEMLSTAVYAAESGMLVLSSLNAAVPILAIQRLVDMAPPDEKPVIRDRLARMFRGIIAQSFTGQGDDRKVGFRTLEGSPYAQSLIRENKINGLESLIKTHGDFEEKETEYYMPGGENASGGRGKKQDDESEEDEG